MAVLTTSGGVPQDTYRVLSTDAAQSLAAGKILVDDNVPVGALITVETNSIRFAFGSTPTQGASGLGYIANSGDVITLTSPGQCQRFSFISHTNGSHGALQISVLFGPG